MKKRNTLKGAAVLLIASVLILTSVTTIANTTNMNPISKDGQYYLTEKAEYKLHSESETSSFDVILSEGFEGNWLPDGWDQIQTNTDTTNDPPGFWDQTTYSVHNGTYAAGLFWSYEHRDEWLISPEIDLTDIYDAQVTFWTHGFEGSVNADHYYVKVSTDGGSNWDELFDLSALTGNDWNEWAYPYDIDLSNYVDETINIAWHAVDGPTNDGLWYVWLIDDVEVTVSEDPPAVPDLDCDGSLSWTDIDPGANVTGTFTVENIGDPLSLLDWEIDSYPDWGTFTFDPDGGLDLTPEAGAVTVTVEVVAPDDPEEEFEGEIVLVNSENSSDTCVIDVALATPVSQQSLISLFFEMFSQRFPIIAQIIAAIF